MNVVFFLSGVQRTIKRSLKFFAKNAKLLAPNAAGEEEGEKVIARFHRLQEIFNILKKAFWPRWQRLLHEGKFQTKILKRDYITAELKFKLIKYAMETYLEPLVLRGEDLTEKDVDDALCESAHFVVRG